MMINLNRNNFLRILIAVAIILFAASIMAELVQYLTPLRKFHGIPYLFSLGLECNFPTYYISLLSFIISQLLFLITVLEQRNKGLHVAKWAILAIGFLLISIDEIVQIHERLINPVTNLLDKDNLGVFTFAWVIPGIILIIILIIYFLRFFLQLGKKTRFNFLVAAILFIGGAVGFELIGGWYYSINGAENIIYRLLQNVEESLEMAGLITFIWALLVYLSENYKSVQFNFIGNSR